MPLSFDLSGVNSSSNVAQRRTSASVLTPVAPVLLQPLELKFSKTPVTQQQQQFTFSFAPATSTLKSSFLNALDIKAEVDQCQEVDRGDDPENDQYTVPPERSLCVSVFCRNETGRRHPRSVLGDHGHLERSSAWIHLIGGLAFVIYTGLRQLLERPTTIANSLVTAACGATGLAFLCSTVYHTTAPSKQWAYWTRLLDYFGIYFAIAVGGICDTAIATRGFENIEIISIVDAPLAAAITFAFFVVRRLVTSPDDTWQGYLGGCSVTFGLFRLGHLDLEHASTRQATSFIVVSSYFVSLPQLFRIFDNGDIVVVVAFQAASFVTIVAGMFWDNIFIWPDVPMSQGRGPAFLSSRKLGCVCSSHAWWHLLAVLASVWSVASRESAVVL
jgi:predicted membrane channel-forming protein YqfA (hemolysin III family)